MLVFRLRTLVWVCVAALVLVTQTGCPVLCAIGICTACTDAASKNSCEGNADNCLGGSASECVKICTASGTSLFNCADECSLACGGLSAAKMPRPVGGSVTTKKVLLP